MRKNDDFYEVMPYAQGRPYRDDLLEDTNEYQELTEAKHYDARAKRTAITTLLVVALVSIALIVIVIRGLQLLQSASGL